MTKLKLKTEVRVSLDDTTIQRIEDEARELGRSRDRHLQFFVRALSTWMRKLPPRDRARMDYVIRNPDSVDVERLLGLLSEFGGN